MLERDGRVLLLRRANSGWNDGKYTLVAGHVDAGESAASAMSREALEEVGAIVAPSDLELVHTMHRNDGSTYIDLYFRASNWRGEAEIKEPEKADDLLWADLQDLPDEIIDTIRAALVAIAAGVAYSEDAW